MNKVLEEDFGGIIEEKVNIIKNVVWNIERINKSFKRVCERIL